MKTCTYMIFCDGEAIRNHRFFSLHPNALPIIAYYDEVETCNPIGVFFRKIQIGMYIFSLWVIFDLPLDLVFDLFFLLLLQSLLPLKCMELMFC